MASASDTIGAILIGALVSAVLSGTVTTQAFIYFRLYGSDDYKRNTFMVSLLWFVTPYSLSEYTVHFFKRGLDALHSSMAFASTWIYLIRHWGDDTVYDFIPWTIALTVAFTAIVTLISHCFFAHRVYVLSGFSWWLTVPILVLAGGRLVSALVSTSEMMTLQSYEAFVDRVGWVFTMGLSLSTAVDVLITLSLITLLQRSRTGFSTLTDHLIDTVTLYTVETGLVTRYIARFRLASCPPVLIGAPPTAVTGSIALFYISAQEHTDFESQWLVMPRNLIFLALHFSISKLYATSTLATLNARKSLRRRTNKLDDHVLPVISSLHDIQSHTQRDPDSRSDLEAKPTDAVSAPRIRITRVESSKAEQNDSSPQSRHRDDDRHRWCSLEEDPLPPV
ncbi:hypothetical protein ONZ51_g1910 [Trametes cubensis]|uniref:DUF6534 domain-containing protein n=1 Tax=Trametes cubensis TaxID=1111947 RepID=A0AAD7U2V9_9APHY|nr:hypothetical protein ONZ51_g1910 [Trametes cubensis]